MPSVLPNVTGFDFMNVKGLNSKTLPVWLLLAPNVRVLELEHTTFVEAIQLAYELSDVLETDCGHLKKIFERIEKIIILVPICTVDNESILHLRSLFAKIFSNAIVH